MNVERHHLVHALETAARQLSEALAGKDFIETRFVWEVIGTIELLLKLEREGKQNVSGQRV